ncbi:hypothetical protein LINGRAHAP2_LOCUS4861 [Linum grandiflorum]
MGVWGSKIFMGLIWRCSGNRVGNYSQPTTLVYRILKAKYFPRGDFLSAVIGSNPNLTWPSIVEAKLAVLQGYQWKVGDGSGIRVWGDPWIRRAGDFHVKSRSPIPDWDLRVSALLMPNGSNWDEDRCARSFSSKKSGGNLGYDGGRGRGRPGGLAL